MELLLAVDRWLKAAALLRDRMQHHGLVLRLEELEGFNQQRQVMAVDGAKVAQSKLLKDDPAAQRFPWRLLRPCALRAAPPCRRNRSTRLGRLVVKAVVGGVGRNLVEVFRDRADILVDRPLVIVQHDDQPLGLRGNIVQRLKRDAVRKRRIPGQRNDVLGTAVQGLAQPPSPAPRSVPCLRGPRRSCHARFPCAA